MRIYLHSELDPDGFEVKARKVLSGLGFHDTMTVPMERCVRTA
jgi:hypothetical protein